MINELTIQNVLNTFADTYIHLFDEFVQRETIKNSQDVVRAYDDWVAGYVLPAYYNNLYITPEINIEYDEDEQDFIVFCYMNIDYNNDVYEIELYDSYAGIYEEYPNNIYRFINKYRKLKEQEVITMEIGLEINYTTKYGFTDGEVGYITCETLDDVDGVYTCLCEQINSQDWDEYNLIEFQGVKDDNVIIMLDDLVNKGFIDSYEINLLIELV